MQSKIQGTRHLQQDIKISTGDRFNQRERNYQNTYDDIEQSQEFSYLDNSQNQDINVSFSIFTQFQQIQEDLSTSITDYQSNFRTSKTQRHIDNQQSSQKLSSGRSGCYDTSLQEGNQSLYPSLDQLNFYSTLERDAYLQAQNEIKALNQKIHGMKVDIKDIHSRLKRSETIKDKSLQELERIEQENHEYAEQNKELQSLSKTLNQEAEIKFLRALNQKLKSFLKDKAFQQNDFLFGIDDSIMQILDQSFSPESSKLNHASTGLSKDYQSGSKLREGGGSQQRSPQKSKTEMQQHQYMEDIKRSLEQIASQNLQSDGSTKGEQVLYIFILIRSLDQSRARNCSSQVKSCNAGSICSTVERLNVVPARDLSKTQKRL